MDSSNGELVSDHEKQANILNKHFSSIFTARHGMQTRSSDEYSVCLSVRLSVRPSHAWIVTKWKKDLSRLLYHTKDNLAEFTEKKNGWWGGDPFYLKFWVNRPPLEQNRRF